MNTLIASVGVVMLLAPGTQPAGAIIGGTSDGRQHPYVAAIQQPDGQGVIFTGTAISPTVVLTVAHGAVRLMQATGSDQARVTFDPVATTATTWFTGTIHVDPAYNPTSPGVGDYAVIVFDSPLPVDSATLPGLDDVHDQLRTVSASPLPIVGYGTTALVSGTPRPDLSSGGTRKVDPTRLQGLKQQTLKLRMPDGDQVCVGDSGGPALLGTSNEIVGVTLGTLGGCISSGTVTSMRVDTATARAFIGQYVTLP